MPKTFASNRSAFGFCARCGFRYPLKDLKTYVVKGRLIKQLVCKDDWDPDHPQLHLGEVPINDPQALRFPAPMIDTEQSRGLFAWNPVASQTVQCFSLPVSIHYEEVI